MTQLPSNPHDGQQVVFPTDEGVCIYTFDEATNSWNYQEYGEVGSAHVTYTDQVLVRDNEEVPGMALADPSELKTQKEVNYWLDEKASQGGGGGTPGKESLPWVQIDSWGMRRSPYGGSPIYECRWFCNQNSIHTWQYEIDVDGDGNWIDIADHPQKDDLGFSQSGEFPNQLTLANTSQEERYPNALMRYRITAELNDVKSELSSGSIAAWEERMDEYDPPLYETGVAVDLDPYATTDYVDEEVEKCLPLAGGTLTGDVAIDQSSGTALRIKKSGVDKVKIEHGGKIFCSYDLNLDSDDRTVVNKGWVKAQIAAIPAPEGGGGIGFTEKYNGNRFYKRGTDTTALSEGEVMFLQNGTPATQLAGVTHVALPEEGIDWTKFTKIGTIEVKNGGTLCGHLQVISATNNAGRNWLVKVKMLDIISNTLDPESGHPCYFWGMFTE